MDAELMFYIVAIIAIGLWMLIGMAKHNHNNSYVSEEWLAHNT